MTSHTRRSTTRMFWILASVALLAFAGLATAEPSVQVSNSQSRVLSLLETKGFQQAERSGGILRFDDGRQVYAADASGTECVGAVRVRFEDENGRSVRVRDGHILAARADGAGEFWVQSAARLRSTGEDHLLVRGGSSFEIEIGWVHGVDADGQASSASRRFAVDIACDAIAPLTVEVPRHSTSAAGQLDITRAREIVSVSSPRPIAEMIGRTLATSKTKAREITKIGPRVDALPGIRANAKSGNCLTDTFSQVSLGAEWSLDYIGDANLGSAIETGGRLQISGNGTSLYHGDDNTVFVSRDVAGDFRAEVTITGFPKNEGGGFRKAGLMVRAGLDPRSPRIFVQMVPDHPTYNTTTLQFDYRDENGVARELASQPLDIPLPVRVAIDRRGDLFQVYYSTDGGSTWTVPAGAAGGSIELPLDPTMQVGMNVASYDAGTLLTAEFDDFILCQPDGTPLPPPASEVVCEGVPVDLIYLLDTSGSMTDVYPGAASKLDAARSAIYAMNDALEQYLPGSRASLVTFAGNRDPEFNKNISTKVRTGLTMDLDLVSQAAASIDVSQIDPLSTTPLATALAKTIDDVFVPQHDYIRLPLLVWLSDTVPNIDLNGFGPSEYKFAEVSQLSLYDGDGNFLPRGTVQWLGNYNGAISTYDGQVLYDSIVQIDRLKDTIPDALIYGVAIQGGEQFREDIMEYAAYRTGGQVFSVADTNAMVDSLLALVGEIDCGVSIMGRIWNDIDSDGVQDLGEAGIANVQVELLDSSGVVIATTTTDSDGRYMFDNVLSGQYTIRVVTSTLPFGVRTQTFDKDGLSTPHAIEVDVFNDMDINDADYGYVGGDAGGGAGCFEDDFADGAVSGWLGAELGDSENGSAVEVGGELHLSAEGSDLFHGASDNGFFLYRGINGEFRAEVAVTGFPQDEGGNGRKVGLMLRTGTDESAARLMVTVRADYAGTGPAVMFDVRPTGGGAAQTYASTIQDISLPVHISIERRDGIYNVGISTDGGVEWLYPRGGLGNSKAIPALDGPVLVGLVASSDQSGTVFTGSVDDFSLCQPDDTEPPPPPPPDDCDPDVPLDVVYVLDMSGSMTWEFPDQMTKFDAARAALYDFNKALRIVDNGSRAALVTFSGKDDPTFNLTSAVQVVSGLTPDFDTLDSEIGSLSMSGIPWRASTPLPLTMVEVIDLLEAQHDSNTHAPVLIVISDTLPNIDLQGEGPEEYPLDELAAIPLRDSSGDWRTPGDIAWEGQYHGTTGTYCGEPLANMMSTVLDMKFRVPAVRMFGVTVVGDGVGLGTYNFELNEYAAEYTNGLAVVADSSDDLRIELLNFLQTIRCGEEGRGTIGDRVWHDGNGNGEQDGSEAGLEGVTVELVDSNGSVIATAVTNSDGEYLFLDVPPGTYVVRVDPSTLPGIVTEPTHDRDGVGTPHRAVVTVGQYEVVLDADFGYEPEADDPPPPVAGCFEDDFEDGVLSAGWTVGFLGNADDGGAVESGGTLSVTGDGSSFFAEDNGAFIYRRVNNGGFRVEVDVVGAGGTSTATYQKTGLVVRSSLATNAARVAIQYQPEWPDTRGSLQFRYRTPSGTEGAWASPYVNPGLPVRLAIQKEDNTYTAEFSQDGGQTWIRALGGLKSVVSIFMGDSLLVGMSATGYSDVDTITGSFDNFGLCALGDEVSVIDEHCVGVATSSVYNSNGDHAVWMPGIAKDLVVQGPGQMTEFSDGTAIVELDVVRRGDASRGFSVTINLSGRTDDTPSGSPKKELKNSAYAPSGPVDPSTWIYYTEMTAELAGTGAWEGAEVFVTPRGPAWQQGVGANNKNLDYGASSWFNYRVIRQPSTGVTLNASGKGDFNLSLECPDPVGGGDGKQCVSDGINGNKGDHAMAAPGLAKNFLFSSPGVFEEYRDGSARFVGRVHVAGDESKAFDFEVYLYGKTSDAPAGSPKLELPSSSYFPAGPADPATWTYYEAFNGTLTGRSAYAGAVVNLTQRGPAWQIGIGANNKTTDYGMSAWFDYEVVQQPNNTTLTGSGVGDFNVNVADVCPDPSDDGGGGNDDDSDSDDSDSDSDSDDGDSDSDDSDSDSDDDSDGGGSGGDDGTCPQTPSYWYDHGDEWPVSGLEIGDSLYGTNDLMYFLGYGGSDAATQLALDLTATLLNLENGSDEAPITQAVADAHAFLTANPPGTNPDGADESLATAIKDELDAYNNSPCSDD